MHDIGQGAPCLKCGDKCPGLSLHYWRKVCRNCRCAKEDHDVKDEEDPGLRRVGRLFDDPPPKATFNSKGQSNAAEAELRYEWFPPGVSTAIAQKYIEALPLEMRPLRGTDGANYRKRLLERQIPEHDIDAAVCDNLTPVEAQRLDQFVENLKQNVVGQGDVREQSPQTQWFCFKCCQPMFPGDVAVFARRAGNNKCWHPKCFVCCVCNDILQDLIYYYKDNKLFCGRHFADSVLPRCNACDELIFNKSYTKAESKPWHVKHFCCYSCDKALAGSEYVPKDQNPYCLECYDKLFGNTCCTCHKRLVPQEARIVYENYNYHVTPQCFHCGFCGNSLVNAKFVAKPPRVFCRPECLKNYIAGI